MTKEEHVSHALEASLTANLALKIVHVISGSGNVQMVSKELSKIYRRPSELVTKDLVFNHRRRFSFPEGHCFD